ncbi:hypothetical protein QBC39DRAFT_375352 [Podospora conica]|nr:hypothetical protein QBC39DRAFT_375352 [Schizothecium conicum]
MLLGAGRSAVADLGIDTIAAAVRLVPADVTVLGSGVETNVRLTMTPFHHTVVVAHPSGSATPTALCEDR